MPSTTDRAAWLVGVLRRHAHHGVADGPAPHGLSLCIQHQHPFDDGDGQVRPCSPRRSTDRPSIRPAAAPALPRPARGSSAPCALRRSIRSCPALRRVAAPRQDCGDGQRQTRRKKASACGHPRAEDVKIRGRGSASVRAGGGAPAPMRMSRREIPTTYLAGPKGPAPRCCRTPRDRTGRVRGNAASAVWLRRGRR